MRDGTVVGKITTAEPGKESTYTDVIASDGGGIHTYTVVPYTLGGAGIPARATAFVGTDIPAILPTTVPSRIISTFVNALIGAPLKVFSGLVQLTMAVCLPLGGDRACAQLLGYN